MLSACEPQFCFRKEELLSEKMHVLGSEIAEAVWLTTIESGTTSLENDRSAENIM